MEPGTPWVGPKIDPEQQPDTSAVKYEQRVDRLAVWRLLEGSTARPTMEKAQLSGHDKRSEVSHYTKHQRKDIEGKSRPTTH